jgi:hypothetical protein
LRTDEKARTRSLQIDARSASDVIAPFVIASDVIAPDVIAPDVIAPDVIAPDVIAPFVIAPDVIAPDVIASDVIASDVIAPDVIATSGATKQPPRSRSLLRGARNDRGLAGQPRPHSAVMPPSTNSRAPVM